MHPVRRGSVASALSALLFNTTSDVASCEMTTSWRHGGNNRRATKMRHDSQRANHNRRLGRRHNRRTEPASRDEDELPTQPALSDERHSEPASGDHDEPATEDERPTQPAFSDERHSEPASGDHNEPATGDGCSCLNWQEMYMAGKLSCAHGASEDQVKPFASTELCEGLFAKLDATQCVRLDTDTNWSQSGRGNSDGNWIGEQWCYVDESCRQAQPMEGKQAKLAWKMCDSQQDSILNDMSPGMLRKFAEEHGINFGQLLSAAYYTEPKFWDDQAAQQFWLGKEDGGYQSSSRQLSQGLQGSAASSTYVRNSVNGDKVVISGANLWAVDRDASGQSPLAYSFDCIAGCGQEEEGSAKPSTGTELISEEDVPVPETDSQTSWPESNGNSESKEMEQASSCRCLNWKDVYLSKGIQCGQGLELLAPLADAGLLWQQVFPFVQPEFCAEFFQRLNNDICVDSSMGSSDSEVPEDWCYVSSDCTDLRGGGMVNKAASWKRCDVQGPDRSLRQKSDESLESMSRGYGVSLSMLLRAAGGARRRLPTAASRNDAALGAGSMVKAVSSASLGYSIDDAPEKHVDCEEDPSGCGEQSETWRRSLRGGAKRLFNQVSTQFLRGSLSQRIAQQASNFAGASPQDSGHVDIGILNLGNGLGDVTSVPWYHGAAPGAVLSGVAVLAYVSTMVGSCGPEGVGQCFVDAVGTKTGRRSPNVVTNAIEQPFDWYSQVGGSAKSSPGGSSLPTFAVHQPQRFK